MHRPFIETANARLSFSYLAPRYYLAWLRQTGSEIMLAQAWLKGSTKRAKYQTTRGVRRHETLVSPETRR